MRELIDRSISMFAHHCKGLEKVERKISHLPDRE